MSPAPPPDSVRDSYCTACHACTCKVHNDDRYCRGWLCSHNRTQYSGDMWFSPPNYYSTKLIMLHRNFKLGYCTFKTPGHDSLESRKMPSRWSERAPGRGKPCQASAKCLKSFLEFTRKEVVARKGSAQNDQFHSSWLEIPLSTHLINVRAPNLSSLVQLINVLVQFSTVQDPGWVTGSVKFKGPMSQRQIRLAAEECALRVNTETSFCNPYPIMKSFPMDLVCNVLNLKVCAFDIV